MSSADPLLHEDQELELLSLLLDEDASHAEDAASIVRRNASGRVPLSFTQQRLWFLHQLDPASPAYNIVSGVRLSGTLDEAALQAGLNEIIRRHEVLRACFRETDGVSWVDIQDGCELLIESIDLSTLPADARRRELERHVAHEAKQPFDLAVAPLLRMRLLRLGSAEHAAVFTMHHIVSDAWSMPILLRELSALYSAFTAGRVSPLPELPIQCADFSQWQHEQYERGAFREQAEYWRRQLAAISPVELITDRRRPARMSYEGAAEHFTVSRAVSDRLKAIANEERATLFMVLLAAFQALLHRYTRQDDIAVGTPIANRNRTEVESLIGFFVNTLVLRTDLSGEPSFRALLRRVRRIALEGYAHQDLPFEKLVQELLPERDISHNPLFQIMFLVQEAESGTFELPGLRLAPLRIDSPVAKFDLTVTMAPQNSALAGTIEYSTALFDAETIARMAVHFNRLLSAFAAFPELPIRSHSLLNAAERSLLLEQWGGASAMSKYPNQSMAALFEEQVKRRPEGAAVVFGTQVLSYFEVDRRAEQLARRLRRRAVGPEVLVGLCAERSLDLVIALVGILKAGGAYVALDPSYPAERIGLMAQDAGLGLVLVQERLLERLPNAFVGEVLLLETALDDEEGGLAEDEGPIRSEPAGLDHLAYVSYTSGSTGRPKGVGVPQRGVVRLVKGNWFARMDGREVFLLMAPVCFDASTFEIWGALLNGAKLVVMPPEAVSLEELGDVVRKARVTTLWLTAGLFHLLVDERPEALSGLEQLLAGGDVLSPAHVRRALEMLPRGSLLINGYGPTENTTFSCCHVMEAGAEGPLAAVPIGRPIGGTSVYLLDEEMEPVPPGVAGELFVGGDGLARGYLGRPALTAERFVPDPFARNEGARLYRTGDLCRWRTDGAVEFLGRKDGQIKVRGYRVELAEVEAALLSLPNVKEAAVVVAQEPGGEGRATAPRLIGYLVAEQPDSTLELEDLRHALRKRLPDYMIPAAFLEVRTLPLNTNGKLDRSALPSPDTSHDTARSGFQPPRNPREALLAAVWQELLGRDPIGVHDNYFQLGGDSITAIQVVSRVRRRGWQLAIHEIFESPTIALLAPRLRREESKEARRAVVEGPVPLSAVQRWFFEHQAGGPQLHHFNQAVALRSRVQLDEPALRGAIEALQRHHDALRMAYHIGDHVGQTTHGCDLAIDFTTVDLRGEKDAPKLLEAHSNALQASIRLEAGPLMKSALYQVPGHDCLLLVIHHLAVDGISWRILLEDLETAYRLALAGHSIELGPKTDSFKRWAELQSEAAESPELLAQLDYWRAELGKPATPLPRDGDGGGDCFGDCSFAEITLSEQETEILLSQVNHAYTTEINDLLLTALGGALRRWHGGEATRITLEGHGRESFHESLDLSRTVGWFTSLFPFVLDTGDGDSGQRLRRVKEALRAVPRRGAGFGVLRYLGSENVRRTLDAAEVPRLSFNYLGQFAEGGDNGLFEFAGEATGEPISPGVRRQHDIDVTGIVTRDRLALSAIFHPERHRRETIDRFLAHFREELLLLSAHCSAKTSSEKTPSDFTARAWTLESYDVFLRACGWSPPDIEDIHALSPMQEGLLFESLYDEASKAYFVQMRYQIRGEFDAERFARSWGELCRRHAILRTSFVHEGQPRPLQVVLKERPPLVSIADLRYLAEPVQRATVAQYNEADLERRFDIQRDPLIRVAIFRLEDALTQVVWSYHHIILDGWSLGILHRDLLQIYSALASSAPPALPEPAPYRDYARWLAGHDQTASRAFWAARLHGYEQPTGLPRLRRRSEDLPFSPAEYILEFSSEFSATLGMLAAQSGVTLNVVFQAAWAVVLARYNRCEDVVFATVVSGRPADLARAEDIVGVFICAVPVRLRLPRSDSFRAILKQAQAAALAAESHHHFPLAEIQALTHLGQDLFDHLLVFENYPIDRTVGDGAGRGLSVERVEAHDRTHYDLDLTIDPRGAIAVTFAYNRNVYPDDQIAQAADHLRHVLEQAAARPDAAVGDYMLATPAETRLVLEGFNAVSAPVPRDLTLVDLLDESAQNAPADRAAVVDGATTLTYRELHERANRLAHALRHRGVGPEITVGLCVDRSVEMVVGALGILKSGGCYVPLDPLYPEERLAFMLADAGARVLVTERTLSARFTLRNIDILLLDDGELGWECDAATPPESGLRPENLAYVVYTSGSTGRPKGVMIEHRTLVNAAVGWRIGYGLSTMEVRLLQIASLSFDVFTGDLIRALTNGGTLVVCDAETRADPAELCILLARQRITLFESTPGLILPLMEHIRTEGLSLPSLRMIILSSDTLPEADYRLLVEDFGATMRIVNCYGVTEATIDSCFYEGHPGMSVTGASAAIGRPFANTKLFVLDEQFRPCPVGVAGELFIGGDGLARGYLNRPELTAERFITAEVAGARRRLYRTGDLAFWLADGNLGFLGRGDDQVKVRGFRVEPGEIESRLRAHPAVRDVVVAARQIGGANELVAYVVPAGDWSPTELRAHLLAELPDHMVPAWWMRIEQVPLSPNGKVDRRVVPAPDAETAAWSAPFVAPRNATEEAIARIWREVLQVARVGVNSNFFELGGHSLKAMQVISRLHRKLGVKISLRAFLDHPTVAALALLTGREECTRFSAIEPAPEAEHYELSHAQQRLWLLHQMGGASAYNMPHALLFDVLLDLDALRRAFVTIIERHEALRTAFVLVDGEPRQRVCREAAFDLREVDLRAEPDPEASARQLAAQEAMAPFDLTQPPLLRATVARLDAQRSLFLLTIHHIVGDGWSGNVLYREVLSLFDAFRRGEPDPLTPLRIQYKDFAMWQNRLRFEREERYWLGKLAGAPELLALPYDFAPGEERGFGGDFLSATLGPEVLRSLRAIATARSTTVSNVVLAILKLLLFQLTKQRDFCVGMSVANRNHPDLENILGFFVNILPIRTQFVEEMDFEALLEQVTQSTTEAFDHQDYPFDLLVRKLNPQRLTNRQPIVNVIYAFQNFEDVHIDLGFQNRAAAGAAGIPGGSAIEHARPFGVFFKTSKFDLTLFVSAEPDGIVLTLEFDTALFRPASIRRYLSTFERFARKVCNELTPPCL